MQNHISAHMTHVVAGGVGGTVGAIVTCPLEVIKTRLQSSNTSLRQKFPAFLPGGQVVTADFPRSMSEVTWKRSYGVVQSLKHIFVTEGATGLFRGLGPNLIGVAPSRAIYFGAYANTKSFLNDRLEPETALVHLLSAGTGGFIASTLTNPLWLVKTRLQLETGNATYSNSIQCVKHVWQNEGLRGFYRGVTASYFGISETMIHFVIYEQIKAWLKNHKAYSNNTPTAKDFVYFMGAAATSKTIASTIAYPHEVARTRLREEGTKYRTFVQTLGTVLKEEGFRGMYGGLFTHLTRQIPNTAIIMVTYEVVVYSLNKI